MRKCWAHCVDLILNRSQLYFELLTAMFVVYTYTQFVVFSENSHSTSSLITFAFNLLYYIGSRKLSLLSRGFFFWKI